MDAPQEIVIPMPSPSSKTDVDARIGLLVGNYRVVRLIGQGGMGAVYEAVHLETRNRIAVKFLQTPIDGDPNSESESRHRFHNEANLLATARHPGLVTLFDSGDLPDRQLYITMELLPGQTLRDFVRSHGGKLDAALATEIIIQTASTLAYVHQLGIVHRDLNPRNLMVIPDDSAPLGVRVKIVDFGIAKLLHQSAMQWTQTQAMLGTLRYMSPEQCEAAKSVDASTDIYSLGLIFFELLTGQSPYQLSDQTASKWLDAHISRAPVSLRSLWPDAPASLGKLLTEMLDKLPDYRPTAEEIVAHLKSGHQIPARRGVLSSDQTLVFLLCCVLIPILFGVGYELRPTRSLSSSSPSSPSSKNLSQAQLASLAAQAPKDTVLIPPTTLMMGSNPQEIAAAQQDCVRANGLTRCNEDLLRREAPPQLVSVNAFYLDKTELTTTKFLQVLGSFQQRVDLNPVGGEPPRQIFLVEPDGTRTLLFDLWHENGKGSGLALVRGELTVRSGYENRPMTQVTHEAARRICQKRGGDLPSEAQWEAAARGAERRIYPWGSEPPDCQRAVFDRRENGLCQQLPLDRPADVGSSPQDQTPLGVYDLGGNVFEWVLDPFVSPYPRCNTCIDPVTKLADAAITPRTSYSVRGGNYAMSQEVMRGASRSMAVAQDISRNLGFRCAFVVTTK